MNRFISRISGCALAALFAILITIVFCQRADAFGPYAATYLNTVDGDTADLMIETYPGDFKVVRIRLDQFDTPEKAGKCEYEKRLAKEASDATERILSNAENINIMVSVIDSFGRPVSVVMADSVNLGFELYRMGLARPFVRGRGEKWCNGQK